MLTELPPLSELSYSELLEEIRREEAHLVELQESLEGANNQIDELTEALTEELSLIDIELYRDREKRIRRLREEIETKREQFRRVRADIETRTEQIREREASRALYLRRSRDPFISITNREVARNVAETLKRSISRLKGWQTRKTELQDTLREELRQLGRTLGGYRRWQLEEEDLAKRITELEKSLAFWNKTRADIETDIKTEQDHLKLKRELLPKLHRVKIRLYNVIEGPSGSPVGMFQGWFDLDVILDEHGEPDWAWWLTVEEIRAAKYHFTQYFKGLTRHYNPKLNEWKGFITDIEGQVRLTQFPNADGIPYGNETAKYHRYENGSPAVKRIPANFVRRAENMTVSDLVVGESSKTPEPVDEPQGVFFQQVMILGVDGTIKWQERRDKWCWRLPESYIKKVKEELG